MNQRSRRKNTLSRLHELGLGMVPDQFEDLFSHIYDMLAQAPTSRPSSVDMEGRLRYYLENAGHSNLYT